METDNDTVKVGGQFLAARGQVEGIKLKLLLGWRQEFLAQMSTIYWSATEQDGDNLAVGELANCTNEQFETVGLPANLLSLWCRLLKALGLEFKLTPESSAAPGDFILPMKFDGWTEDDEVKLAVAVRKHLRLTKIEAPKPSPLELLKNLHGKRPGHTSPTPKRSLGRPSHRPTEKRLVESVTIPTWLADGIRRREAEQNGMPVQRSRSTPDSDVQSADYAAHHNSACPVCAQLRAAKSQVSSCLWLPFRAAGARYRAMSEEQISTDIQKSKTAIEKLDEHGNRPLLPRVVVEIPRVACTGETRLNLRPCFELPAFRRQPFRLPPRNGTGLNGKGPSTNGSQPEPSSRSWAERQTACKAPLDFLAYRFRESVKLTFNIVLVGDLATVSRQRFSQYFERWCPKEEKLDAWHKLLKKMDEAGITFAPGNDTELSED